MGYSVGKMADRKRKIKKAKNKLAKFMKSLILIKPRIPVPPSGYSFKSDRDYDRRQNKKAIQKELDDND